MKSLPILPVFFMALAFLLSTDSAPAQGDFQKAVSFYKQKQYREAAAEFQKLVEDDPLYETGYRVMGDCYLKLKRWADASDAFEKAVELDPENFVSAQGLAMARFNLKDFEGVISTLSKAENLAKSPPQKYQLHHIRGSAYYQMENFTRAVEELSRAVSIQRGNFSDILQLGVAHFRLDNLSESESFLRQAISIRPNSREAREFLAQVDFRMGNKALRNKDYPAAADHFASTVDTEPDNGEAWFNLGLAYLFSDEFNKAEDAFRKCLEIQPERWQPYDRLGYLFEVTERYEQSLENYQEALRLHNDPKLSESVDRVKERIKRRDSESR